MRALSRGPRRQTRVVSASLGRRDMRDDDFLASARRTGDADGTESSTSSRGDAALEATTRVTGEGFHRVVDVRVSGVERVDDAIAVAVVWIGEGLRDETTTTKTRNTKTKEEKSVEWARVASGDVDVERMAKYASTRATCARMLTREETPVPRRGRALAAAHASTRDATPGGGARGEMVDDVRAMVMRRDGSWTSARSRAIGEAWMVPVGDANCKRSAPARRRRRRRRRARSAVVYAARARRDGRGGREERQKRETARE